MEKQTVEFPLAMREYLKGKDLVEVVDNHRSGDKVYQVDDTYILKMSENVERLRREMALNDYLRGRLPVSETVAFAAEEERAFYLKTMLRGDSLADKKNLQDPRKLVELLVKAVHMFHGVDGSDCPIKCPDSQGSCFVHGDFCLPNRLVWDGEISGFIDTEAGGLGDPWIDYAWCIWSLEYNLGTDEYTPLLLEGIGIEFDKEIFDYYTRL